MLKRYLRASRSTTWDELRSSDVLSRRKTAALSKADCRRISLRPASGKERNAFMQLTVNFVRGGRHDRLREFILAPRRPPTAPPGMRRPSFKHGSVTLKERAAQSEMEDKVEASNVKITRCEESAASKPGAKPLPPAAVMNTAERRFWLKWVSAVSMGYLPLT